MTEFEMTVTTPKEVSDPSKDYRWMPSQFHGISYWGTGHSRGASTTHRMTCQLQKENSFAMERGGHPFTK